MSAQDKTFIDAYGLELNDELQSNYADATQPLVETASESNQLDSEASQERKYRFDRARASGLRGPHFDMRRMAAPAVDASEDTFDTNVIDVGAAWAFSVPIDVQASIDPVIEQAAPSELVNEAIPVESAVATDATEEIALEVAKAVASTAVEQQTAEPVQETQVDEVTAVENSAVPVQEATDTEPPQTIKPIENFAPVWEVDRFNWPDEIEQLFKSQVEYFDYAGKKLVAASREGLKILAVTSTRHGEGSTTLALCLARAAAGAGATVGLLDGNLERSELGEKLGVDFASGWQTAAAFEQSLAEAAILGLEERITLFPSTAGPVADLTSLADERVGQVFRAAAANYDLLIIDAGTADLGCNTDVLDAAIVVRDVRHTSESETLVGAAALRDCGVKAVGIAENYGSPQTNRAAA